MGIEGYTSWLKQIAPSAFSPHLVQSKKAISQFDRIYVDFNGFLHRSSYRCITDEQLIFESHRSLQYLLHFSLGMPVQELYIAMDGAASVLKMKLQRERRRDIALDFERRGGIGIASQKFTPGCMFMGHLEDSLIERIAHNQRMGKYCIPKVIIDGASRQGEGELKIIHKAMSHPFSKQCIISFDSDSLLHCLLSGLKQLTICNPQQNFWFSVDEARRVLKDEHGIETDRLFGLMSNFMGNDFTPKLRFGSIRILFSEFSSSAKAQRLKNCDILEVLTILAESYVKALTPTELALYESCFKKYSFESNEEREWSIARFLYMNQWLLDSIYHEDLPDDIRFPLLDSDTVPRTIGPCIGDFINLDLENVRKKMAQIVELNQYNQNIKKLPAAVAMTLIDPKSSSIEFLPNPIQSLCKQIDYESWNDDTNCKSLLKTFTSLIESLAFDIFTEKERNVSFPQNIQVITSARLSNLRNAFSPRV